MDMNRIGFVDNRPVSIPGQNAGAPGTEGKQAGFQTLLQEKAKGLNFSKHAAKRMNERGIAVDNQLMSVLEHSVVGARKNVARDVAVIGAHVIFILKLP